MGVLVSPTTAMVLADLSSSEIRSASFAGTFSSWRRICDCNLPTWSRWLALALQLCGQHAMWPGRSRQEPRQVLHFDHHAIEVVEQRLQQVGHAAGAVFIHQRAVIPNNSRLGSGKARECQVSVVAQVAQHGAHVVQFVGRGHEPGFGILMAYPAQVAKFALLPTLLLFRIFNV